MNNFTQEELNQIIALCDIATRTKGLELSPVALNIAQKADQQIQRLKSEESKDERDS